MKASLAIFAALALFSSASASVLSTTDIATVLAGAQSQSSLTVPAAALAAIKKLGKGGVNAASLSAADKAAINKCVTDARNNNGASKAGLGGGTGSPGNIVLYILPFHSIPLCLFHFHPFRITFCALSKPTFLRPGVETEANTPQRRSKDDSPCMRVSSAADRAAIRRKIRGCVD